ncbi:hypothetical protein OROHE_023293 [Orobanche hederae]
MNLLYPNTAIPHSHSGVSLSPPFISPRRTRKRHGSSSSSLLWDSSPITVKLSCICVTAGDNGTNVRDNGGNYMREEESEEKECVEVIMVGSRKDAVLDFCCRSPFLSPVLRFWNILVHDSEKVQLQQRSATPGNI